MFRKYFPLIDPNLIGILRDENKAPYFDWKIKNDYCLILVFQQQKVSNCGYMRFKSLFRYRYEKSNEKR